MMKRNAEMSEARVSWIERHLANKLYNAHLLARERSITADVLMRHSQVSTGYWDVVQDTGADVVRVMMLRCHDKENFPHLYQRVRGGLD